MAITPTNNLGLRKPDRDENFNVANIYNYNLDTIDEFAGEIEGFIENSGLVAFGQYWSNEQAFSATREPMKCPTLKHSGGNFQEYFTVSSDGGTFTCIKECIALVSAYVGFSAVPTGTAVLDVAINNEEFQRNQAATNAWSPFQYDFSVGDTIKFEAVLSTAWTANRGNHVDFVVLNEKTDEPIEWPIATPTQVGGIKPGTGFNISGDGTLTFSQEAINQIGAVGIHDGSVIPNQANCYSLDAGNWTCLTAPHAASLTNAPFTDSSFRMVIFDTSAGTGRGRFYLAASSHSPTPRINSCTDYLVASSFTGWRDLGEEGLYYEIGDNRDIITNTTDLNTLLSTPGSYTSQADPGTSLPNAPRGSYYGFDLTTIKNTGTGGLYTQEFLDRAINTVYRRSSVNATSARPWAQEGFTAGRLYANTDLNTIVEPGRYATVNTTDASTLTNVPGGYEGTTNNMVLIVEPFTSNASLAALTQRLRTAVSTTGDEYYRSTTNGGISWTNWIKINDIGEKYKLENRTAIPSGADLNEYVTPGSYVITTNAISQSLLNSPPGLWLSGVLTVGQNASGVMQELLTYDGTVYIRYSVSGTFQPWITSTQATGGYVANVDLNDYVQANKFTCAANCLNLPVNAIGILEIENTTITAVNSSIQTYTVLNTGVAYRRNTTNAGTTWTSWKQEVTRAEYDALAARVAALESA